ncbi:hypothetical protein [Flaviflexus sp.]|uniref:hypothetical protein n=1 Tax=Flaviflexus sp. TaxID=1969482 RepID=UPI003F8E1310
MRAVLERGHIDLLHLSSGTSDALTGDQDKDTSDPLPATRPRWQGTLGFTPVLLAWEFPERGQAMRALQYPYHLVQETLDPRSQ